MFSSFTIFGRTIHMYGVCCFVGIAISVVVVMLLAKRKNFEFFDFSLVVIITLLSALVGSKLVFFLVSWNSIVYIFQHHSFGVAVLSVMQGGFVFYGGLIGGIIGLFITAKVKKVDFFEYANIFALVLPLGHAFGRIGCFFAGCCYGIEHTGFLSFTYHTALDTSTPIGVPLLAVQLIESALLFILFIGLTFVYFKFPNHRNLVSYIYLFAYAILRFSLEFFRGDLERGLLLNLSTSQWISILIVVGLTVYIIVKNIKVNRNKKSMQT